MCIVVGVKEIRFVQSERQGTNTSNFMNKKSSASLINNFYNLSYSNLY